MPIRTIHNKTVAGTLYGNPFVGEAEYPAQISVNISVLTANEIDTFGFLKPGVPFIQAGTLAAGGASTAAAPTAEAGNVGNGTVTAVTGPIGGATEVISVRLTSATAFDVTGSASGYIGAGVVGTPFVNAKVNLTVTAGGTAFAVGDRFDVNLTAAAGTYAPIFGVTVESINVLHLYFGGPDWPTSLAAAGTQDLVVITIGQVNRHIIEDNLGRALTAAEVAAFSVAGSTIKLLG